MGARFRVPLLWAVAVSILVLAAIRFDLVPWLRGPAPYPPEWQWRFRPHALTRALPALPVAAALVGLLLWSGSAAARRSPRRAAILLLTASLGLGFLFPLALLESEDGGAVAHLVSRTASPAYLSYHAVACSPVAADPALFLRRYASLLPALPMHAATHPPGPVLFYRGLIELLSRSPALAAPLMARVERACAGAERGCSGAAMALSPVERAAALLGALLAHAAAVAALVPLAWLAFQLTRDRLAAARVAALWTLVPGAALFLPALDPALALPVLGALFALRLALAAEGSGARFGGAALCGAATAAAGFLSYGALVQIALGAAGIVASLPPHAFVARLFVHAGAVAGSAFLALSAIPLAWGYDPIEAARTAVAIHRDTYTAQRSYALWLAFGPLDFALFLGVPLAVLLAARRRTPLTSPPTRLAIGFVAALAVLTLTGAVRGEVGRLLVPWMPLGLLAAVLRLDDEPGPDARTAAVLGALLAAFDVTMRLSWRL
jgi:hypothetical protein